MWPTCCNTFATVGILLASLNSTETATGSTISGQVRFAVSPNDPVSDARLTLFTPALTFFAETRTDGTGAYSIDGVPAGTFQLGCAALGFDYVEETVSLGTSNLQRDFDLTPESHPGQWDVIGSTAPEFLDATDIAVLLASGKVFYCHDTTDPILFDPVTGTKSFPSGSPSESGCMNSTVLSDGSVIMVGGQDGSDPGSFVNAVPWVKQYVPGSDSWNVLPDVQHTLGRWYPGLTRLADGSLLVMGGGTCCSAVRTDTAERFDLVSQTWSYTGPMLNPCEFPPSALLYTGEVLATWSPPQLYNTDTEQWRFTGNFKQSNRGWPGHSDHSIIVLHDGCVLAIGILSGSVMGEIYDPATETWSLTSNPGLLRLQSEVVQLPDGRVFVGGGETEDPSPPVPDVLGIVKWCDLYDPPTDTWRRVADMAEHREYHAVTLLIPDGRVITTGGTRIKFQKGPTSADIEAFSPPYLFRGVRPDITSISSTQPPRGSELTLEIAPETQLTSVVLMGAQTTTHWVDGGIPRRLVLPVRQSGASVTASLPSDPNILPLGHYMVFAMVDDIPSAAEIVQVVEAAGTIPAVSEWGLISLTFLIVSTGTVVLGRRGASARSSEECDVYDGEPT
ncbi:MAG: DUF1929 domain-containing protein [bacterium]|nr:DUF1929 domain-containing protein [bacterium]